MAPQKRSVMRDDLCLTIPSDSIYTLGALGKLFGLGKYALPSEIRSGRLKASRRCGRYLVLGKWVIEWIEQGAKKRARCHVASADNGRGSALAA